jgi:hypothetical protein
MAVRRISLSEFVDETRRALRSGRLTFLTGAGVSMLPPSNLPSGAALKDFSVRTLCSHDPLRLRWGQIARNDRYQRITPEILFQRFYACLGEATFLKFFETLRHARANSAHRKLAELATKKAAHTLTTNFDLLIDSQSTARNATTHLHGALDRPETMVTRINQVGRGLEGKLQHTVAQQISGKVLCVLGYSGADNDIWAAVQASRVARILWLVRKIGDQAQNNLQRFGQKHPVQFAVTDLRVFFEGLAAADFGTMPESKGN